ncbi:hypothetical protein QCA50_014454 [Cerrena zonata]|uniref:Uncharacterized protein n=1 Tax=Cerrena zonata TaxID=2478898 RepID=A0AAW0FUE4_9APHY
MSEVGNSEGDVVMKGLVDQVLQNSSQTSLAGAENGPEPVHGLQNQGETEDVDMDIGSSSPIPCEAPLPTTQDVNPGRQGKTISLLTDDEDLKDSPMSVDPTTSGRINYNSPKATPPMPLANTDPDKGNVNIIEEARRLMGPIILQNALRRDPTANIDIVKQKLDVLLTDEHCQHFVRLAKEAQAQMANVALTKKDSPSAPANNSRDMQGPNVANSSAGLSESAIAINSQPSMTSTMTSSPNGRPSFTAPLTLSQSLPPSVPTMPRAMMAAMSATPSTRRDASTSVKNEVDAPTSKTLDETNPSNTPNKMESTEKDNATSDTPSVEVKENAPDPIQTSRHSNEPEVNVATEHEPQVLFANDTSPVTDEVSPSVAPREDVAVSTEAQPTVSDTTDPTDDDVATSEGVPPADEPKVVPPVEIPSPSHEDSAPPKDPPIAVEQQIVDIPSESQEQSNAEVELKNDTVPSTHIDAPPEEPEGETIVATVPQSPEREGSPSSPTPQHEQDEDDSRDKPQPEGLEQVPESNPEESLIDPPRELISSIENTESVPITSTVPVEEPSSTPVESPIEEQVEQQPETPGSPEPPVDTQSEVVHEPHGTQLETDPVIAAPDQDEPSITQLNTEPESEPLTDSVAATTPETVVPSVSPIPGLWLVIPGNPHSDILSFDFSVDANASAACERWAARHMKFDASDCYVKARLLCLPLEKVTETPYLLDPSTPLDEVVDGLGKINDEWPEPGKLIIELHAETGEQRIWLPRELSKGCLDVSPYIRPGLNTARFVQLSDMSDRLFVLIASSPSQDEIEALEKLARQRSIWSSFVERTMARTFKQSGIKVSHTTVAVT